MTVISYYQNFNYDDYHVGDIIDQTDILTALLLLLELRKMNFVISRLDINGPDMLVFRTSENQEIKASSEKKLEEQLIDLKNLIVKIKVENINYKSILINLILFIVPIILLLYKHNDIYDHVLIGNAIGGILIGAFRIIKRFKEKKRTKRSG